MMILYTWMVFYLANKKNRNQKQKKNMRGKLKENDTNIINKIKKTHQARLLSTSWKHASELARRRGISVRMFVKIEALRKVESVLSSFSIFFKRYTCL